MKVSRKSWHYRVWAYKRTRYCSKVPPNLCKYFWMIIWKIFIGIPLISICPIFGMSMDADHEIRVKHEWLFSGWLFMAWFAGTYSYLFLSITGVSLLFCVATWLIGGAVALIATVGYIEQSIGKGGTFINVMVESVRAKKNKICPTIEVV